MSHGPQRHIFFPVLEILCIEKDQAGGWGPVHSVACMLSLVYPLQVLPPPLHLTVNCSDCQQNIKTAAARAKLTQPPVSSALQLIASRSLWPMGTSVFHLFSPQMWRGGVPTFWGHHLRNTLSLKQMCFPQSPGAIVCVLTLVTSLGCAAPRTTSGICLQTTWGP